MRKKDLFQTSSVLGPGCLLSFPSQTSPKMWLAPFSYDRFQKLENVFQTLRNTLSDLCPKSGQAVLKSMYPRPCFVFNTGFKEISAGIQHPLHLDPEPLSQNKDPVSIANLCFPARSFPHSESNLTERANQISSFHLHIFETLLLCTWSVIQSNSFHAPPHVSPPLGYSPPLGSSLLSTSVPHSCLLASESIQNPAPWTNSSSSLRLHLELPSASKSGHTALV